MGVNRPMTIVVHSIMFGSPHTLMKSIGVGPLSTIARLNSQGAPPVNSLYTILQVCCVAVLSLFFLLIFCYLFVVYSCVGFVLICFVVFYLFQITNIFLSTNSLTMSEYRCNMFPTPHIN